MNIRTAYERVDRHHDGQLTRAELIRALRRDTELQKLLQLPARVGDTERTAFERVFQGMDVDDDDHITMAEFASFLRRPS